MLPRNFILLLLVTYVQIVAAEGLIVGFLPIIKGKMNYKYDIGAFIYSLHDINSDPYILPNNTLRYVFNDTHGDTHIALRALKWQYDQEAIAIIGPDGSCVVEATVAAAWNIPVIAYNCRDSEVSNSSLSNPTFARTVPPTSKVSKSVISVLKEFGWSTFVLVAGNSDTWREAAETLQNLAGHYGITATNVSYFDEPYLPHTDAASDRLRDIILDTYESTRVYVVLASTEALIDFARHMQISGISKTGEYVTLGVHSKAYDPKANKNKYHLQYYERDKPYLVSQDMIDAFKSVLIILPRPPSNPKYEHFLDMSRKYSEREPFNAPKPPPLRNFKMPVTVTAAYLYDAVYVYAKALDRVLRNGEDPRNGTLLMSYVKGNKYKSIRGYEMFIDQNGDVEGNYTLLALQREIDEEGYRDLSMRPTGYFVKSQNDIPELLLEKPINWILGKPPSEPVCGFDGSKCQFEFDWQIAVICIVVISLMTSTLVFLLRHYRYEQKLASLTWKIDFKDLLMAASSPDNTSVETEDTNQNKVDNSLNFLQTTSGSDEMRELPLFNTSSMPSYMKVASYKGSLVRVRMLQKRHIDLTRSLKKELHIMKDLHHDNINRFIGACVDAPNMCIVTQYCLRGSLKDILENNDLYLDDMFIASLVSDLVKGMIYLHDSEIGLHGNLKSTNCLVDSRWVLQISDFGLPQLSYPDSTYISENDTTNIYDKFLWTAPEILRNFGKNQRCDVYSFGIILYEIHGRNGPWGSTFLKPIEIISRLKSGPENGVQQGEYLRPNVLELQCAEFMKSTIQDCWHEDPEHRPDFKYIRVRLKPMQKGMKANIFDNMLAIMEKYATNLEAVVEERTVQLVGEKKKTEALLLRMLPRSVADQLIKGMPVIPEQYDCVTIYFSDIVGFTSLSAKSKPMEVVDLLNDLYTLFDSIIRGYDVYKVETIGDAYMVVSGLPERNGDNHAGEIGSMSLHLIAAIKTFKIRSHPEETMKLRVGIHSGPVCTGVVGVMMPRYCLFGDTVNTASRMESNGISLKIHCSSECQQILYKLGGYILEERGYVNMKGKGELLTFFLLDEDKSERLKRIKNLSYKNDCESLKVYSKNLNPLLHHSPNLIKRLNNEPNLRNSFKRKKEEPNALPSTTITCSNEHKELLGKPTDSCQMQSKHRHSYIRNKKLPCECKGETISVDLNCDERKKTINNMHSICNNNSKSMDVVSSVDKTGNVSNNLNALISLDDKTSTCKADCV